MPDGLITFWRARLDETETAANAAREVRAEWYEVAQQAIACTDTIVIDAAYLHIAGHDPDRAVREVDADRKLLREYERLLEWQSSCESHRRAMPHRTPFNAPGWPSEYELQREEHFLAGVMPLMKKLIKERAAVYSGHPDYRMGWQ